MGDAHKYTSAATRFLTKADFSLPDRCTVERHTVAKTADGGNKPTYSTLHSSVPCMEIPRGGVEGYVQGKVLAMGMSAYLMPSVLTGGAANTIAGRDRFTVAARSPHPAKTVQVEDVDTVANVYLMVTGKVEG